MPMMIEDGLAMFDSFFWELCYPQQLDKSKVSGLTIIESLMRSSSPWNLSMEDRNVVVKF